MAKKKSFKMDNWTIIAIVAVIAIVVLGTGKFTGFLKLGESKTTITSTEKSGIQADNTQFSSAGDDSSFITARLYDANGNLITNTNTQSIVGGTPGVSYIDITIAVTNTGTQALSCSLSNLNPSALSGALSPTVKAITVGGKTSWTSSRIPVAQFESAGSVTFSATATCTYNPGTGVITLPSKVGSFSLTVTPEAAGSFDVAVTNGGLATEYCGDAVCSATEDATSCPTDCVSARNVRFRTTDSQYVSGSAIAYGATCGGALTKFGYGTATYLSGAGASGTSCMSATTGYVKIMDLPGTLGAWSSGAGNVVSLFSKTGDANTMVVCGFVNGKYAYISYTTTDSDATKVDASAVYTGDSMKEVACN